MKFPVARDRWCCMSATRQKRGGPHDPPLRVPQGKLGGRTPELPDNVIARVCESTVLYPEIAVIGSEQY
jgi:hypothetical protein